MSMWFSVFMDKHFCLSEEPEWVCACMCISVRDSAWGVSPLLKDWRWVDGVELGFSQAGLCPEAHGRRAAGQGKPIHLGSHGEGGAGVVGLHGWG